MYDARQEPNEFVADTLEDARAKAAEFFGTDESSLHIVVPAVGEIFGAAGRSVIVAVPRGVSARGGRSGGDGGRGEERGGRREARGDRDRDRDRDRGGRGEGRGERSERGGRGERSERGEREAQGDRDRGERNDRSERSDRGDRSDRGERSERGGRGGDREERGGRGESEARGDRDRDRDREGRGDRVDRQERGNGHDEDRGRGGRRERSDSRGDGGRGEDRGRERASEDGGNRGESAPYVSDSKGTAQGQLGAVGQFLLGAVERMKLGSFEISEAAEGDFLIFQLRGAAAAALARGDGRATDALQLVANQISMRQSEEAPRVVVDVEGGGDEREQTLTRLAERAVKRARETGRSIALDPMNSRDRRAIHIVVREMSGVATMSIGEGRYRQVLVVPEGAPEYDEALSQS